MATPTTAHDGPAEEHEAAVRVGNELLRELCAGTLRAAEVPARALDLAAHPDSFPDDSGPPPAPGTTVPPDLDH